MQTEDLSKRDLARTLHVSEVTISNWMRRGMPCRSAPSGDKVAEGYKFDLNEVIDWRRGQKERGIKLGGVPLEELPPELWDRPDLINGIRHYTEDGANAFLWHWWYCDEGFRMVAGYLLDTLGDKLKAADVLRIVNYSLTAALVDWIASDAYNRAIQAKGRAIDDEWHLINGAKVNTNPPRSTDVQVKLPEWIAVTPEQFVRDSWPDQ